MSSMVTKTAQHVGEQENIKFTEIHKYVRSNVVAKYQNRQ